MYIFDERGERKPEKAYLTEATLSRRRPVLAPERVLSFLSFSFFLSLACTFRLAGDLSIARVSCRLLRGFSFVPPRREKERKKIEKAPFNEVTRREVVGIVASVPL